MEIRKFTQKTNPGMMAVTPVRTMRCATVIFLFLCSIFSPFSLIALEVGAGVAGAATTGRTPSKPQPQPFDFGSAFGDNMVLQRHPSRAAIYGFLGPPPKLSCSSFSSPSSCVGVVPRVTVSVHDENGTQLYEEDAVLNVTKQPFGGNNGEWGVRPCTKSGCPPYDMKPFNPWNEPLGTWKVWLRPTPPGGNYTIVARRCTSNSSTTSAGKKIEKNNNNEPSSIIGCQDDDDVINVKITNVTFGDVWYCSGQSNMWLPVLNSFSRNETVNAIRQGRYNNLRVMAGSSANHPHGGDYYYSAFQSLKKKSSNIIHHDKEAVLGGGADFNPGYGKRGGSNPWMTAYEAVSSLSPALFNFGAACWYFGQRLSELGVSIPIGLTDTAIGGQRIEEYMDNATVSKCSQRSGEDIPWWDGQLFALQVVPFVDMTIKGWIWYQGENNMHATKGNSAVGIGYGCEMQELIKGWRSVWSQTPNTTDPLAPFGVVTLASSGSEGGPNMGAMRHAQTANHGVLPNSALPNTFLAQAYDLNDEWGPALDPGEPNRCFGQPFTCCNYKNSKYNPKNCNATMAEKCQSACNAATGTPVHMGGIHPRNKKPVGDRLGTAAFNLVYNGTGPFTGPTLAGCSLVKNGKNPTTLRIQFDAALLRGDSVALNKISPRHERTGARHHPIAGGSQLYVQTDSARFCIEPIPWKNSSGDNKKEEKEEAVLILPLENAVPRDRDLLGLRTNKMFCPFWAGGERSHDVPVDHLDDGWTMLNFTLTAETETDETDTVHSSIDVDLSPLNGLTPTAVRYAWGIIDCCDYTDPDLYVTHGCMANCPIVGKPSGLPGNPFQARIVNGKCDCVYPQVCSSSPQP